MSTRSANTHTHTQWRTFTQSFAHLIERLKMLLVAKTNQKTNEEEKKKKTNNVKFSHLLML